MPPIPPVLLRSSSHLPEHRVPPADWDQAPWNRWSFQHIREVLPTVEVWRGRGPVSELPTALEDIERIGFVRGDGTHTTVGRMLTDTWTDGFLVLHRGRIVAERYLNGMTERTLHLSQSVAKSVTATVVGALIERGKLDPLAPVTHYLPELEATAYKGARLQHVLDMTSGVRYSEVYTDRFSDVGITDVASGWKPVPAEPPPTGAWPLTMWDQILSLQTLEAEHGARFEYRSIETDVLALCMERVTGRRLAQLVSDELWAPMGAEESACFTVDRAGYALADGGFNATLRDYARVGLLHLNRGVLNGRRIVPSEWIDDIRHGDHGLANDMLRARMPNGCYRNQFWIADRAKATAMCRGVFGQLIYIAPEHDLVVVKLSSYPEALNLELSADTQRAIDAIAAALQS